MARKNAQPKKTRVVQPQHRLRWREPFLVALAAGATVKEAAAAAGVSRKTVFLHRKENEAFAAEYTAAADESVDELEGVAKMLAIGGVVWKKFSDGRPVIDPITGLQYEERVYNPAVLMFLLKCRRPEVYGDRVKVENVGPSAITVTTPLTGGDDADANGG